IYQQVFTPISSITEEDYESFTSLSEDSQRLFIRLYTRKECYVDCYFDSLLKTLLAYSFYFFLQDSDPLKLRPSQAHSLPLFLSLFKMSTSKDNWKPEETRYFFQLYAEERRKGNKVGQQMNKVGKKNIMDAFELRFKKGFSDWKRDYKKKYDSSRKKYIMIRMLTQNRTGLGYDWWKERERVSFSFSLLRKEKDVAVEACEKRTAALEVKNMLAKQLMEREQPFSVETVLEMLYALPEVREWSPLYEASIELLIDSEGSRRGFITMKTDEAKTKFLELRTKIKRDE
ncbi:hypothetical protein IGI04_030113, partial [Brassica rapa subsp. trilocularis]